MDSETSNDSGLSEEVSYILHTFDGPFSDAGRKNQESVIVSRSSEESGIPVIHSQPLNRDSHVSRIENHLPNPNYVALRRKIERQRDLIFELKEQHGLVITRLQDEFEAKLGNITRFHSDLLASTQRNAEDRTTGLTAQLEATRLELKSLEVVSSRLSTDYSVAVSDIASLRTEQLETRTYIQQLENRLREFHVPLPRSSVTDDGESSGYQLLSTFRRRFESN